ncbi:P-loop containing nucleoside triphosphate hydrolase protein [Mycena sp. CBHHK59/15]|nr:P-loop containing nucleoside triphosphate hydrolase protein [Mycena sp. CBHHK59/15]
MAFRAVTNVSSPIAVNRLLQYIETRDQAVQVVVRPWVWILVIFLAPVVASLGQQWYIFINTRTLVRAEAIITYGHSVPFSNQADLELDNWFSRIGNLRIRMKAETTAAKDDSEATPGVSPGGSQSEDESATVQASSSSVKSTRGKEPAKPVTEEKKKSEGNLVGRINNLVTTDLGNITDSRDFLVLLVFIPLQIAFSIWFLYAVLGWAVWVGVASILLLAPAPGYMAKFVQSVQKERLKRTDERVQSVSEAVNVLRMTLIMGQPLNASKVFSSMTVFDLLRDNIAQITGWLNNLATGKVSMDRVNDFLHNTELLDAFDEKEAPALFAADVSVDERIGFRNATFSWSKESDGSLTRSQRAFVLKIDGEVLFKRDRINLVVGPTGSGKTSLLMALLGEMHWIPSSPDSWYNLPRESGVAYAAQESWVLNQTIRDNIVFNAPFDEERYKKVVYQLTLARAIYSKASILLLDDILAALDVHTAQWIVDKCFGGDLIENRTIILVTHNIALAGAMADFVVTFGSDGRIREDQKALDKSNQEIDAEAPVAKPADGKLILAEEIHEGHVSASALKMYLLAMAGQYPVFFFAFFFGGLILQQILVALRTWQLGYWALQYDSLPADEVDVVFYLSVFGLRFPLSFDCSDKTQLQSFSHLPIALVLVFYSNAPLRWLDVTPASRIIARVTNDVRAVDDSLPNQFWPLSSIVIAMLVRFGAVVIYTPIFFFPGVLIGAIGGWIGQIYIAGQLPVKRLMSNSRAPVLAHFGAAIAGLVSIRAFGAESQFLIESLARIDRYTRAARSFYNLNRWVSIRVDLLGSIFSAALATYIVYIKQSTAGDAGFLINMAVTFTSLLLWVVRVLNEFEVQGNSLERIQAYVQIEHEKPATEAGKPPAYWPASGDLRVERLFARYSEDGPKVLQDISFHIKSGERVGVVGRTGSGKSSLTLSLLRCIPTEGSVRYDGVETSELNLDSLRSSITIIPQVPELLSGSLRVNLDPFGQYDDAELNYALRAAGLFALQSEMDEGRITLDSAISSGGGNLSVGQRQIFALARAIVRKSKILILDEATSAIDYKTDTIIQNSLRQELRGDVSLITVAHRLQTIMDADKIMVLAAGRIVEFDSPKTLLKIEGGKLRALVDESGDREALYAMAGAR